MCASIWLSGLCNDFCKLKNMQYIPKYSLGLCILLYYTYSGTEYSDVNILAIIPECYTFSVYYQMTSKPGVCFECPWVGLNKYDVYRELLI